MAYKRYIQEFGPGMVGDYEDMPMFDYMQHLNRDEDDEYYFDDEESGERHFYDPKEDEFYNYHHDMMYGESDEFDEAFIPKSKGKPKSDPAFDLVPAKRAKKGGGVETGWTRTKKTKVKKRLTKLSKSQAKQRAVKSSKTKKKDTAKLKKSTKKAIKTRKLNKK